MKVQNKTFTVEIPADFKKVVGKDILDEMVREAVSEVEDIEKRFMDVYTTQKGLMYVPGALSDLLKNDVTEEMNVAQVKELGVNIAKIFKQNGVYYTEKYQNYRVSKGDFRIKFFGMHRKALKMIIRECVRPAGVTMTEKVASYAMFGDTSLVLYIKCIGDK